MPLEYCEHNRRGLILFGLYGRFRVYTCALDKRRGEHWLAGFPEPCVAQCTNHFRKPNGERGHSFPYKRIDFDKITLNDEAIKQEEKEKVERMVKVHSMRKEALDLIAKANDLEKVK